MKHIWILSSIRSGSWFLCDLINKSSCYKFGEYMHWNYKKRQPFPPLCKVIRRHFLSYHKDEDKNNIEVKLPGLKYIWLHRKDNFARAISFYFSLLSKIWRTDVPIRKNEFLSKKEIIFPFIPELALKCYAEVSSEYHNNWNVYLNKSNYLYVDYEDLISNPHHIRDTVLDYLEIEKVSKKISFDSISMDRPQTQEFIDLLKKNIDITKDMPIIPYDSYENIYKTIF